MVTMETLYGNPGIGKTKPPNFYTLGDTWAFLFFIFCLYLVFGGYLGYLGMYLVAGVWYLVYSVARVWICLPGILEEQNMKQTKGEHPRYQISFPRFHPSTKYKEK